MTTRKRHTALLGPIAAVAAFVLACAPAAWAASARTLSPLPASDYSVRSACAEPAPGQAGCLALELVPDTQAARAHRHPLGMTLRSAEGTGGAGEACESPTAAEGCFGMRPSDLHHAYELPNTAPDTQTIALVDAYNDLTAEADLEAYDEEFGLPACTAGNGCFKQVNQQGEAGNPPFPKTTEELEAHEHGDTAEKHEATEAAGWTVEISLDIETARAICHNCDIALVEASSATESNLDAAENAAVGLDAGEISNSWGGPECIEEAGERECLPDSSAFEHPGTVITVAAGDFGYDGWDSTEKGFADFPASSPHVVAVGGTRLLLSEDDVRTSETVWNDGGESGGVRDGHGAGGGGCSAKFKAPLWQQKVSDWSSVGCASRRAVADVSADADPYTGLAVYDSSSMTCESEGVPHWCTIGGTSLASPLIAAVFALAGGAHGVEYPAHTLYENEAADPSLLHDVTEGSNGECTLPFDNGTGESGCATSEESKASCSSHLSCTAGIGYDGPSGLGTPAGLTAFEPPAGGGEESGPGEGVEGGESPEGGEGEGSGGGGGESGGGESKDLAAERAAATLLSAGGGSGLLTQDAAGAAGQALQGHVRLSGLALTLKAILALNTSRPRLPQVSFTFTSNLPVRVRVSLQKLLRGRRHAHWAAFGHTLEIAAKQGRNTQRMSGRGVLSSGSYRLTATPAGGAARSIVFKIG